MDIYSYSVGYFKRLLASTLPIPVIVIGGSFIGIPPNTLMIIAFLVSAITLEIYLYHER